MIGSAAKRIDALAGRLDPDRAARLPAASTGDLGVSSRLVRSPVFVLSSVRSGSTLLRVILNSHPAVHAPPEMHLRMLQVKYRAPFVKRSMVELGLDNRELENMLWDQILLREREASGCDVIVDKTPGNTLQWERIAAAWPEARFIFLHRHPATIYASLMNRRSGSDPDATVEEVKRYVEHLIAAHDALGGCVVTYEDLTADPTACAKRLCTFLDIPWDPGMVEYGEHDHGPFEKTLGDWSSKLKSGSIQPPRDISQIGEYPSELDDLAARLGYEPPHGTGDPG